MASGTILGTTSNEYINAKIEWYSVANKTANTSTVTAALYYTRNNTGYTTYGTGTFSIIINGQKTSATKSVTISEFGWTKVVEATVTVAHNSDGSKSITISALGGIPDTSLTISSVIGTANLDTIPRASTITSALNATLGENCSVTWTPLSSGFTYKLNFSIGGWSHTTGVIKPNKTSAYTYTGYTLPLDVAKQLPNATNGNMNVILATYSDQDGKVQVGSNATATITITVPNNESTQPTVSMSLSPSNNLSSPYNGLYLQGYSRVKATLGFGTKYDATVESSNITVNGNTYASPYESEIFSQAGKVSVKATVKDSRGYYGTNYIEIDVIPYSKPYVRAKSGENSIVVARCNSSAELTDSGKYLKIKAKAVYSKVISNGVQNNYGKIKFRYRKEGGAYSSWQTILDCKADNSDEVITPPLLNGALDISSNYQVQIIASDDLNDSDPITIAVPSDEVYMDRPAGGKSMGLGGYSSGIGNLDIYWKTKARGGISLFNSKGDEIDLSSMLPLPHDQVASDWNPDALECGIYVVAKNIGLKTGDTYIMYNGVLIQMKGDIGGNVKIQLALPIDENRNPMYRLCWYGNWSAWRSMKL